MSASLSLARALAATPGAGRDPSTLPDDLAHAVVALLPFDWAGLTLITVPGVAVPIGASDPVAATTERLQFSLAQGPCLEASTSGRTVVIDDTADVPDAAGRPWPVYRFEVVQRTPIRSVVCIPVRLGADGIAVLGLYSREPRHEEPADSLRDAHALAACVRDALEASARPLAGGRLGFPWLDSPAVRLRRMVWLAAGMTMVEAEFDIDDALTLLRARAYLTDRSLDDIANDVLTGRLSPADLVA